MWFWSFLSFLTIFPTQTHQRHTLGSSTIFCILGRLDSSFPLPRGPDFPLIFPVPLWLLLNCIRPVIHRGTLKAFLALITQLENAHELHATPSDKTPPKYSIVFSIWMTKVSFVRYVPWPCSFFRFLPVRSSFETVPSLYHLHPLVFLPLVEPLFLDQVFLQI